jgi:predicted nucleic acid-binding protein
MARDVVVDACCLLNLLATRRELDIVRSLDLHLVATPQVSAEALTLWTPPDADGQRSREPTSTDALRQTGYLETLELDGEAALDAFISAASRIEDTDASCIALAGASKLPLMTDDRKERRVARDLFPTIELISTLDLLAEAGRALSWSESELRAAAHDLRWRGNFAPPRSDPRGSWYETLLIGVSASRT